MPVCQREPFPRGCTPTAIAELSLLTSRGYGEIPHDNRANQNIAWILEGQVVVAELFRGIPANAVLYLAKPRHGLSWRFY